MKLSTTQKVLAVVLGSAIAVAFVLTATVVPVGASGYVFTRSLTVGSTGADVTALQLVLNSSASTQVAATGAGSPGMESSYFGGLTKAALAKFQEGNGISPASGYFGPITRAFLNNLSTTPVTTTYPAGCTSASGFSSVTGIACTAIQSGPCSNGAAFNSVTGASCSNPLPAGCTTTAGFSPTTGIACSTTGTVVSQNGTDGTLSAGVSSYVSSGITLKKGDTKDILAVNLKASVGPVTLTRVAVHFNTRPWLVLSQVTLHDSNGKVLATKALSSAADATEITVGSDYLVDFGNVNYTVTPGTNVDLVVGATVLSATDKINGNLTLKTAFDPIRTINGIGWTDSTTQAALSSGVVGTDAGVNSVTLSSTASTADINVRVSPNSPVTRQVAVSATQTTSNVVLGTFSLKSSNNPSTLNELKVAIASTTGSAAFLSTFSNVRLFNGSTSYGGVLSADGTVDFTNLTLPLSQDAWQDYTVEADIASGVTASGVTVALTGTTANIVVTDANYNTATVNGGVSTTATTNPITFTVNAITVTNVSATLGSAIVQSNVTTGYNVSETFTINNTSNTDLYVSATSSQMLTNVTVTGSASTSALSFVQSVSPSSYNGDVAAPDANASYVIPAGLSRTFTLVGVIRGASGQTVNMKVDKIRYGLTAAAGTNDGAASTGNNQFSVAFGLENLSLTASF